MAETITIPSPSVFLRASPDPPNARPNTEQQQPRLQQDPDNERTNPAPPKKKNNKKRKTTTTTTTTTTAATSKSRGTSSSGAVAKPKQSKSRNGCVTCKAKRLKCDEVKPSCQQCKRRNVECGGYKKDFKWRPFEETNVATNIAKQNKGAAPLVGKAGDNPDKVGSVSPNRASSSEEPTSLSPSFSQQVFALPEPKSNGSPSVPEAKEPIVPTRTSPSRNSPNRASSQDVTARLSVENPERNSEGPSPDGLNLEDVTRKLDLTSAAVSSASDGFDFDVFMADFPQMSVPAIDELNEDYDRNIEEIARMPSVPLDYDAWALRLASHLSFEDDVVETAGPNTLMFPERITYLYEQPSLSQTSPEMMMLRFDRLTCGILSIKDGPNENPWRTLIWPMAQTSPALYHAVCAMTAFHSSRDIPALRVAGHEHKSASLKNLLEGIEENSMNIDTAIATTIALAFAETWDQHISSGNSHIQGTRSLIDLALQQHRQVALKDINLVRLKFLCNAWVYLDVISRVTTADVDETDDYDKLYCLYSEAPTPAPDSTGHAGFGIDFGMPIDAQLDPLMGCASTLFPLIGRVANLVRRSYRSESNSPPMISKAMELKLLLETWDPPAFIEPPEDPTSDVSHSLQTAEAYRWATLLYLHQALPEIPGLSAAEMAKKVLVFLATVPLASRCVISQIYPLFMASCEAEEDEDRQWIRSRWGAMAQRMRIGIIDKCVEVIEEVWRRRDEYNRRSSRRNLVSTADLQAAGIGRPGQTRRGSSFDGPCGGGEDVFAWADNFLGGNARRRRTVAELGQMDAASISCRDARDAVNGASNKMHTVRGRLHWCGVMKDWGWEVLLG